MQHKSGSRLRKKQARQLIVQWQVGQKLQQASCSRQAMLPLAKTYINMWRKTQCKGGEKCKNCTTESWSKDCHLVLSKVAVIFSNQPAQTWLPHLQSPLDPWLHPVGSTFARGPDQTPWFDQPTCPHQWGKWSRTLQHWIIHLFIGISLWSGSWVGLTLI